MECPACAETSPDGATWCEACGQDLNAEPVAPCQSCGEREVTKEGYCGICGHKQPEERDHMEFGQGALIAVTDRGRRHHHNEDAAAIGEVPGADGETIAIAIVVCDGVSSTPGSAQASEAAANAAVEVLVSGLGDRATNVADATPDRAEGYTDLDSEPGAELDSDSGSDPDSGSGTGPSSEVELGPSSEEEPGPSDELARLIVSATSVAQAKAAASPVVESNHPGSAGGPPSSTFVALVARPDEDGVDVTVGWLGDSRAYWLGDESSQLTIDHEIEGSLSRWIGADSPNPIPDVASFRFEGLGYLIVCSDGLWRYAPTAQELKDLVQRLADHGASGTVLGSQLIDFANENGGHDNITAAVWTNHPSGEPEVEPESVKGTEEVVAGDR